MHLSIKVKHLNGDLRALLLVQSGVKEINTTELKVIQHTCTTLHADN